jgi:nickel/cobalt exporter
MSAVAAALTTAALLGVTHAIEPDHVAGITALTGRYADSRLSALVGACFSVGHVALVVGWLAVAYAVLERTTFPAVLDLLGTVGAALLLGGIGAGMTLGGLRTLARGHARDHDDADSPHVHLPLVGRVGSDEMASHDHGVGTYLQTGLVGALFTLSPPLSMIAFSSSLFGRYGPGTVVLAVVVYAVAITATMGLLGAGTGTALSILESRPRVRGGVRALAGALATALAVGMLAGALPALV